MNCIITYAQVYQIVLLINVHLFSLINKVV